MAPDVWAWADSDAEVKSYVLKRCVRAGCDTREVRVAEFKRCGGCKEVVYCGQACQKEDWKAHKPSTYLWHVSAIGVTKAQLPAGCKEHQEQKRFMKAMMNSRTTPLSESGGGPIVASADFSAAGISTTFH